MKVKGAKVILRICGVVLIEFPMKKDGKEICKVTPDLRHNKGHMGHGQKGQFLVKISGKHRLPTERMS